MEDIQLCETQSLIEEPVRIKSLVNALDPLEKPFWVSFTLDDLHLNPRPVLRSGQLVTDAVRAMVKAEVDAILFNCCQPEVIGPTFGVARDTLGHLGAGRGSADCGCCGIGPEHILILFQNLI